MPEVVEGVPYQGCGPCGIGQLVEQLAAEQPTLEHVAERVAAAREVWRECTGDENLEKVLAARNSPNGLRTGSAAHRPRGQDRHPHGMRGYAPFRLCGRIDGERAGGCWCAGPTEAGNVFVMFFQTPIYE